MSRINLHPSELVSAATQSAVAELTVREYRPGDASAVFRLYRQGHLIPPAVPPKHIPEDLQRLPDSYREHPHDHFWVVEAVESVVATLGLKVVAAHVGEVRRLRIEPEYVRPQSDKPDVLAALWQTLAEHVRHSCLIKLRLDSQLDPDHARQELSRRGFLYSRTRREHEKPVMQFYANLYQDPNASGELRLQAHAS